MVNKSHIIGKLVFDVVADYSKRQNDTKLAFFNYLSKGKSKKDFEKIANKLWDNIDHDFMEKQVSKLEDIIHDENVKIAALYKGKQVLTTKKGDTKYLKLVPESEFNKVEERFKDRAVKYYEKSLKSVESNDLDSETYLSSKIRSYDENVNQAVAYYNKEGHVARHVDVSSYLSMLHNTNLTRSAWNTTLNDADKLGAETFIIPPHPFSCDDCQEMQGIPLSLDEVMSEFGVDEETDGELLHPNCKCTLSILWSDKQLEEIKENTPDYSEEELHEQYEVRQMVNSATLQKERIENDKKIAKMLGNEGLVDKYDKRIEKLNDKIEILVNTLPTNSLKKQVEAIYR